MGTVPEQSRPSELLISGEFNPDSTVFGPDNISNGIWMSGKASASIKSYYRALDCNDNYPDSTLKYPPIINKIQETVATYARSNRSKVSTVPIEIVIPASLSGRVWFDANHNGIQDKGESSIIGAKVQLVKQYGDSTVIDINGNEVKPITTTSPDGYYEFTNLLPGSYVVKFTLPEGSEYFGFTYTHKGSDSSVDSDAIPGEPVTDRSVIENVSSETDNSTSKNSYVGNISLSAGEDKKHIDAGAFKKDEPKDPQPKPNPKPKDPQPKHEDPKDPKQNPNPKDPKKDKPKSKDPKPKDPNPEKDKPKDPKPNDEPKKDEPEDPDPKDTNPKSENPKDNENPKEPESKKDDPKPDDPDGPDTDYTESNDPPQYEDPQPKEDSSGPNHSEIRESDNPIPSSNNDLDSNNSQSNESSFDNNNADFKQEHVRDKLVNTGVSTVFTAVASVAMLALGATNKIKRYLCRGKHRQ